MKIPRIIISGLSGGGGKTLLSLGLIQAFCQQGMLVKPYKKGPDYIDAAWLSLAANQPCTNLDPFFLPKERLRQLLVSSFGQEPGLDLAIIEGNRGLYDGRDVQGSCSTASLAQALETPVILSLDCTKATRTLAAVVAGLQNFAAQDRVNLAGIVLNRLGSIRHEQIISQALHTYTGVPVLGALPRLADNPLPERHMGLNSIYVEQAQRQVQPEIISKLQVLGKIVREHVDIHKIMSLANQAPELHEADFWPKPKKLDKTVCIGYVKDAALWFYYPENLQALQVAGAKLIELSLFDDQDWPKLDGLYLGGGFPEMLAQPLSQACKLQHLKYLAANNLPIYAECGGLMILCSSLKLGNTVWPMSGVFPTQVEFCEKPQGLGYVQAQVVKDNAFFNLGTQLIGHEFHYSRLTGSSHYCLDLGHKADGLTYNNTFAAYTHIFAPSNPNWADNFVKLATEQAIRSSQDD